jgi:hypothetical protein
MDIDTYELLKEEWTDQFVTADESRPELKRFKDLVGRVVTVNHNHRCLVDFADGAWYDIAPEFLKKTTDEAMKKKYDPTANSSQPLPKRQGG